MIREVFIPLALLGKQQSEILELYTKRSWFKPKSCFSELNHSTLSAGIVNAEKGLNLLKQPIGAGMIYAGKGQSSLSSAKGTATGLVIENSPYQWTISIPTTTSGTRY